MSTNPVQRNTQTPQKRKGRKKNTLKAVSKKLLEKEQKEAAERRRLIDEYDDRDNEYLLILGRRIRYHTKKLKQIEAISDKKRNNEPCQPEEVRLLDYKDVTQASIIELELLSAKLKEYAFEQKEASDKAEAAKKREEAARKLREAEEREKLQRESEEKEKADALARSAASTQTDVDSQGGAEAAEEHLLELLNVAEFVSHLSEADQAALVDELARANESDAQLKSVSADDLSAVQSLGAALKGTSSTTLSPASTFDLSVKQWRLLHARSSEPVLADAPQHGGAVSFARASKVVRAVRRSSAYAQALSMSPSTDEVADTSDAVADVAGEQQAQQPAPIGSPVLSSSPQVSLPSPSLASTQYSQMNGHAPAAVVAAQEVPQQQQPQFSTQVEEVQAPAPAAAEPQQPSISFLVKDPTLSDGFGFGRLSGHDSPVHGSPRHSFLESSQPSVAPVVPVSLGEPALSAAAQQASHTAPELQDSSVATAVPATTPSPHLSSTVAQDSPQVVQQTQGAGGEVYVHRSSEQYVQVQEAGNVGTMAAVSSDVFAHQSQAATAAAAATQQQTLTASEEAYASGLVSNVDASQYPAVNGPAVGATSAATAYPEYGAAGASVALFDQATVAATTTTSSSSVTATAASADQQQAASADAMSSSAQQQQTTVEVGVTSKPAVAEQQTVIQQQGQQTQAQAQAQQTIAAVAQAQVQAQQPQPQQQQYQQQQQQQNAWAQQQQPYNQWQQPQQQISEVDQQRIRQQQHDQRMLEHKQKQQAAAAQQQQQQQQQQQNNIPPHQAPAQLVPLQQNQAPQQQYDNYNRGGQRGGRSDYRGRGSGGGYRPRGRGRNYGGGGGQRQRGGQGGGYRGGYNRGGRGRGSYRPRGGQQQYQPRYNNGNAQQRGRSQGVGVGVAVGNQQQQAQYQNTGAPPQQAY